MDTVDFSEEKPIKGWIAGVDFLVMLLRQVLKNKDGSKGIRYLVCSDLDSDTKALKAIYKKRWKVEACHKTVKSNASPGKVSYFPFSLKN